MTLDKLVGGGAFFSAWVIFIYYTLWALIMPLLDETNSLQRYFPPFEYAILLPFYTLIAGVFSIVAFFIYASRKQKAKQTKKSK